MSRNFLVVDPEEGIEVLKGLASPVRIRILKLLHVRGALNVNDIAEALQLARAYTTNVVDIMGEARPTSDPAHIELFSDGNILDLDEHVLRPGETLTFHAMGSAEADNVAFASISVERPFDRPTAVEVFASLLNFNQSEVLCDVQLSVNGTARGIREVPVQAAQVDLDLRARGGAIGDQPPARRE